MLTFRIMEANEMHNLSYLFDKGRRKRGGPRKTWLEGVQAAMTTRNLELDQWRNREEWRLVSGRQRQLLNLRRLMSYIYMEHPLLMFLDHTQRRSTVGRTPLDE